MRNIRNPLGQGHANSTGEIHLPREPGKHGSDPKSAGGADPLGRALFEFKGKMYLASFPLADPMDVEFVDLDDLPHFVGGPSSSSGAPGESSYSDG